MEPYETWRYQILNSNRALSDSYIRSLPESYLQALYEHSKDPCDKV